MKQKRFKILRTAAAALLFFALLSGSVLVAAESVVLPPYAAAKNDRTNIRTETSQSGDNVVMQVGPEEILQVIGYSYDMEGTLWWRVIDSRSGKDGYVIAEIVDNLTEEQAKARVEQTGAEGEEQQQNVPAGIEAYVSEYPYYAVLASMPEVVICSKTQNMLERVTAGEMLTQINTGLSYPYSSTISEVPDVIIFAPTDTAIRAGNQWLVNVYISKLMFMELEHFAQSTQENGYDSEKRDRIVRELSEMMEKQLTDLDYDAECVDDGFIQLILPAIKNELDYDMENVSVEFHFLDEKERVVDRSYACYESTMGLNKQAYLTAGTEREFSGISLTYSFDICVDGEYAYCSDTVVPARQFTWIDGRLMLDGEEKPTLDSEQEVQEETFAHDWIEIENVGFRHTDKYTYAELKIKNASDIDYAYVSLMVEYLDENGDIDDTAYATYSGVLKSGQAFSDDTAGARDAHSVRIASGYVKDMDGNFHDFYFMRPYEVKCPPKAVPSPTPSPAPKAVKENVEAAPSPTPLPAGEHWIEADCTEFDFGEQSVSAQIRIRNVSAMDYTGVVLYVDYLNADGDVYSTDSFSHNGLISAGQAFLRTVKGAVHLSGIRIAYGSVTDKAGKKYSFYFDTPLTVEFPERPAPTAVPTAAPTAVPTAAPTAVPTAAPTAVPTAAPTAVPTAAPTAPLTQTAEPTVKPTATPYEKYPCSATVIKSAVNVRAKAGTDSKQLAKLDKNDKVTVLGEVTSGKTLWYRIVLDQKEGYVRGDLIELEEKRSEAAQGGMYYLPKNVKTGDVVTFGTYEQDNRTQNGKEALRWKVLAVEGGKALLITETAIDSMRYSVDPDLGVLESGLNWKTSYLRQWLNDEFLKTAFEDEQRNVIAASTLTTSDKSGKFSTEDRVFCLSIQEAEKYFAGGTKMACKPSEYAKAKLRLDSGALDDKGNCGWWLRDMISVQPKDMNMVAWVCSTKGTWPKANDKKGSGMVASCDYLMTVRPAMWVQITGEVQSGTSAASVAVTSKPTSKPTPRPTPKPTPKPTKKGLTNLDYAVNAFKVLKTMMKDPSTMQIHGITCFSVNSDKVMVVFDVTGKNGLGGVTRSSAAFYVKTKSGYATYDKAASAIPFQMYYGSRIDVNEVLKSVK